MESKSFTTGNRDNPNTDLHGSKNMMASHFLRALFRIQQTSTSSSSFAGRSRRIRRAAYASMAYSAGARRAWSRALLRKLRSRARLGFRGGCLGPRDPSGGTWIRHKFFASWCREGQAWTTANCWRRQRTT
ncbi:unnamed protein product [Musa textilis]